MPSPPSHVLALFFPWAQFPGVTKPSVLMGAEDCVWEM